MNRYDYYTRCANIDEQEWLTEELYYPDGDDCGYDSDYEDDYPDDGEMWLAEDELCEPGCGDVDRKKAAGAKDAGKSAGAEDGYGAYDIYGNYIPDGIDC